VKAELFGHGSGPLEVEVVPVPLGERPDLLRGEVGLREQVGQLVKEVLESGRADDLEDSVGSIAGVPERVPLVSRLERRSRLLSADTTGKEDPWTVSRPLLLVNDRNGP
jgi:hypothetical protein